MNKTIIAIAMIRAAMQAKNSELRGWVIQAAAPSWIKRCIK